MAERKHCRLCTKAAKGAVDLFTVSSSRILRRVENLIGIRLEDMQDVPRQICKRCMSDLDQAYSFRKRCIEAQQYFSSLTYKRKLRDESEEETSKSRRYSKRVQKKSPSPVSDEEPIDIFVSEPEMDEELLLSDGEPDMEPIDYNSSPSRRESGDEIDVSPLKGEIPEKKLTVKSEIKDEQLDQTKPIVEEVKQEQKDKPKRADKQAEYVCDQCGRHFKSCTQFNIHLRKREGIKPYQCEICSEAFYTQATLTAHMNRHAGKQPLACRYCPRRFTVYSSRIRHERTHTNERPYLCTQCGKAFTQSYYLKNHMLVHTGERSFECRYCEKNFARQTHLATHYRSLFHKQNVEKYERLQANQMKEETAQEQLLEAFGMT